MLLTYSRSNFRPRRCASAMECAHQISIRSSLRPAVTGWLNCKLREAMTEAPIAPQQHLPMNLRRFILINSLLNPNLSLGCRQVGVIDASNDFTDSHIFHRPLAGVPAVADPAGLPRHE